MLQLIEAATFPIMVMNYFAGIVGGIWLLLRGDWRLVLFGILGVFLLNWVIAILSLIRMPFGLLAIYFQKRSSILQYFFGYLAIVILYFIMIGTCFAAYMICLSYHDFLLEFQAVPYLLWAWGIGLGHWQYEASKSQNNINEFIALLSISVFFLLFLIGHFLTPIFTLAVLLLFMVVQLLAIPILQLVLAKQLDV